jgi:hypothetical protein
MPETNPYAAPQPAPAAAADRILIRNYNQAGGPLAIALLFGPLALAALIWAVAGGHLSDPGEMGTGAGIMLIVLGCLAELSAIIYALRVPVLWAEIGPTLRYGSLLGAKEVDWNDVQRIWVDRDDTDVRVLPLVSIKMATHWMLVIRINDYKDLNFHVPTASMGLVETVMRRHPRFKDSPFDDEPPDESGEDEVD